MFKTLVRMVTALFFNELTPNQSQMFAEGILWFIHTHSS